jgi:membrane-bound lytic murein transglycosylase B
LQKNTRLNRTIKLAAILIALGILSACSSIPPSQNVSTKNTIQQEFEDAETQPAALKPFLEKLSQTYNIPLNELELAFSDARTIPSIKKLVLPPPPGFQKNWKIYRSRFIEPKRLAAGQQFWLKHKNFIQETANETGVAPEVIVAIIGIETIYGRHMGGFSARDTLMTLGFQYPNTPNKLARESLFKEQLEELVLLCWGENPKQKPFKACLNQTGSYAGAIGLPQFMPSSIRKFGVDGDKDGKIDLRNSPKDAIASVGNFLKMHGWVKDEVIYLKIKNSEEATSKAEKLADGEAKAKLKIGDLVKEQILDESPLSSDTPSLIIDLPSPNSNGGTDVEYVIGLKNFLVICDYNRSFFYAQSVAEFAEAIKEQMGSDAPTKKSKAKIKKTSKKKSSKNKT